MSALVDSSDILTFASESDSRIIEALEEREVGSQPEHVHSVSGKNVGMSDSLAIHYLHVFFIL